MMFYLGLSFLRLDLPRVAGRAKSVRTTLRNRGWNHQVGWLTCTLGNRIIPGFLRCGAKWIASTRRMGTFAGSEPGGRGSVLFPSTPRQLLLPCPKSRLLFKKQRLGGAPPPDLSSTLRTSCELFFRPASVRVVPSTDERRLLCSALGP